VPVLAERRVDRRLAGTGLGERERGGDQNHVVLVAAVGRPRTVLEVDAVDRGEHRGDQDRSGQRCGCAEQQQGPAPGLCGAGRQRVTLTGTQPEILKELTGALEAMAAKPAEQLLGAVSDEESAHGETEEKASNFH
jgi:hypothetical protein